MIRVKETTMTRYLTLLTTLVLGVAVCGCRTVKPGTPPPQERSVRIDVQTILVDTSDMGEVAKGQVLTPAHIEGLRKAGKASLVTSEIVMARIGQEAVIKGVTEYTYPTAYTEPTPEEKKPKVTVNVAVQETTVVPSDFATREVGNILHVTPVYLDRNRICLRISRMTVKPPMWMSYPGGELTDKISTNPATGLQPVFRVAGTESEIVVSPNHPIVLSAHPQSNIEHKTLVTVMMATLVD